jgi:serine/threonine protein kinase
VRLDDRFSPLHPAAANAQGAFGRVYRAVDTETSKHVAVKVLERARTNFARFEREAEVLATVRHPNVVGYVDHGLTPDGAPYLAMEWLDGVDLAAHLRRGPLPEAEALAVVSLAAEGLGAAHALQIVHRDVKPSNLFLVGGRTDDVRVIDFGVARAPRSRLTSEGAILGTPAYMAPEQAQGAEPTPRVDVFALGCVLFECLAGESPYDAPDAMVWMRRLLQAPAPSLRERCAAASEGVDQLVAAMLSREPEGRPADGGEVARWIARTLTRALERG